MVRPSILITDDDAALRATLHCMLEPLGYRLCTAGDGEEALDIVTRQEIHLLLCDYQMPRLSGLETIQRVRSLNTLLPCILMSGGLDEMVIAEAERLKAFSILAKPVPRQLLRSTVQSALERCYGWTTPTTINPESPGFLCDGERN
ncbi:MAG: response regulator [Pirellulales bacterium]